MWSYGGNVLENRYDLSFFLSVPGEGDKWTSTGRLFQTIGASKAKLSPNCFTNLWEGRENLRTTRIFASSLTSMSGIVTTSIGLEVWTKTFGKPSVKELWNECSSNMRCVMSQHQCILSNLFKMICCYCCCCLCHTCYLIANACRCFVFIWAGIHLHFYS